MGNELRDTKHFSWKDKPIYKWKWDEKCKAVVHFCDELPGLLLLRNVLSTNERKEITTLLKDITSHEAHDPQKCNSSFWSWFEYDPGRYIVPLRPHLMSGIAKVEYQSSLDDFEVFGNVPLRQWLDLNALCDEKTCNSGAKILRNLQDSLVGTVRSVSHIDDLLCFFIQIQKMEGGVKILPHLDADDPPVDVIATVCLDGGDANVIRVGNVELVVGAGDAYVLSDFARHCVKHEVLSSPHERTSMTFRFVSASGQNRKRGN